MEALYQSFINGDEKAFEHLFKEFYAPLCGYAGKYLHDRDLAEEVIQNLFCHLWEKRGGLSIKSSFSAYLYTSARNRCLNELRREKRQQQDLSDTHLIHEDGGIEEIELDQQIEDAISSLPEMSRKVFLLNRVEGKKYAEIADFLGIGVKAVEANMSRALKKLREELKDYLMMLIFLFFS